VASVAVWFKSIILPTRHGEYMSYTTAQYILHSRVECAVMSATHN